MPCFRPRYRTRSKWPRSPKSSNSDSGTYLMGNSLPHIHPTTQILFERIAKTSMSDVRLYFFECGTLKCKVHDIKMNQGFNEPCEIPVPWFLIEHPKGNVVIDGGNAIEVAYDSRERWGAAV